MIEDQGEGVRAAVEERVLRPGAGPAPRASQQKYTASREATSGHEVWMRRAIELATRNVLSGAGGPFGAVIVRDGVVLAEGANEVTATNDPTAHAEVVAIRKACRALGSFELSGCAMYASCEPCPMCLAAIYWARMQVIYHGSTADDAAAAGFDDALFYREIGGARESRSIACVPLLREEAKASFAAWTASELRLLY